MDKNIREYPIRVCRTGLRAVKESYNVLTDGKDKETMLVNATFGVGVDYRLTSPCVFAANNLLPLTELLKSGEGTESDKLEHYFSGRRSIYSRLDTVFMVAELKGRVKNGVWSDSTSIEFFVPSGLKVDSVSAIKLYDKSFIGRTGVPAIKALSSNLLSGIAGSIDSHVKFTLSRLLR